MPVSAAQLVELVCHPDSSEEKCRTSAGEFLQEICRASPDAKEAALRTLAATFGTDNSARAAFLALVCGAMIEDGANPAPIAEPLTFRLRSLLESSAELADACQSQIPAPREDDEADPVDQFAEVKERLAKERPREAAAWEALDVFWRPAIALYSVSDQARDAAKPLQPLAAKLADFHEGGHWLQLMLSVLTNEPLLVIEPSTMLGFAGRFSGIVDNFQLNVLLMDKLPLAKPSAERRVAASVAETARGLGPQQTEEGVTSVWNLYTYQPVRQDLTLPDPNDYSSGDFWIWNEGKPADIPVFEGKRSVLLGPASYPRSWQSQRMFANLPAGIEWDYQLPKAEITTLLERMARQNQVERQSRNS